MTLTDNPPVIVKPDKKRKPRPPQRWTLGHVLPFVLAIFAVIFVLATLRDRAAQTPVVVAARQIPAGATINAGDTRTIKIATSDADALTGLLSATQIQAAQGAKALVAATTITAGEPIIRTETIAGPAGDAGLGSMSLPVPVDRADGGALSVGDTVDVIDATTTGASYLAQGLTVLAVSTPASSGVLAGTTTDYWITVAVNPPTALRLAAALAASSTSGGNPLEIVRSTGEPASTDQTYTDPAPSAGTTSAATSGASAR
jgi:hypothetical protein